MYIWTADFQCKCSLYVRMAIVIILWSYISWEVIVFSKPFQEASFSIIWNLIHLSFKMRESSFESQVEIVKLLLSGAVDL